MTRLKSIISLLFVLASVGALANNNDEFWSSEELRDSLAQTGRPIYFDNPDLISYDDREYPNITNGSIHTYYLPNRLSLTGETCTINKLINSVGVGSWSANLGNLLNDNLDDYCEFNAIASVGVTVNPYVSVRDRSCYYAKGTQAGFCIVSGSGDALLSLDVVKALAIGFYRDGELVGTVSVKDGQAAGGVNLGLIKVPGSDDANIYLTAEAPDVFDEISLDPAGGVNISATQLMRIKYAFVGRSRDFTVTRSKENGMYQNDGQLSPYQEYLKLKTGDPGDANFKESNVKIYDPVLLGIPIPFTGELKEQFIDGDYDNGPTITPILAVGYQGGAKFVMHHQDQLATTRNQEIFKAGTEVGFSYTVANALNLGVGTWLQIVLFDINGNKIHTEEIQGQVLGLGVAGGGKSNTSIVSPVDFSGAEIRFMTTLSLDLGGIQMHNGFIREQPDIRHHCPINPSASTVLCREQTAYQLQSNPEVSIIWTIESKPEGSHVKVTPSGFVTGMDDDFADPQGPYVYVFRATAPDGCFDTVTITKGESALGGAADECGDHLVNDGATGEYDYLIRENFPEFTGGLINIGQITNPQNIINPDPLEYVEYIGGAKVATNVPVIGIRRTDDGYIFDGSAPDIYTEGVRLGFMVSSEIEGLNLAALQFWQIRCYDEDFNEVYRGVVEESNAISADIAGTNAKQKMRYSIKVPTHDDKRNPIKVKILSLWSSGVLDIEGGKINIYYPFRDDINSPCNDPLGCDANPLSYNTTHTTLDFDLMQSGSAIVVANAVNDLSNLIDDDMESYMSLANSVSLGAGIPIAVKLGRTLDYRHQLGIVMDNKTFLAGIDAGEWLTIEPYYRGEPTGEKFTDWNVVNANVIGYGDKNILVVQPKMLYDEFVMTIAKVVGALDIQKFYGFFLRGDIDNDGIPDCQDLNSCVEQVEIADIAPVCEGEELHFEFTGNLNSTYYLYFSDDARVETINTGDSQKFHYDYVSTSAGKYQVAVFNAEGNPVASSPYTVHPKQTTWAANASNSDWNKWDNWTNGSPYCCTDVIIPSGAKIYPHLSETVVSGDEYCCDRIHFEPGAEINRVNNLNYSRAWVEFEVKPNRYYDLSSPLQGTYTGDMFIPAEMKGVHSGEVFTELDATTAPENRFDPTIYQRLWNKTALDYSLSTGRVDHEAGSENVEIESLKTTWSHNFNALWYGYGLAEGFGLWVDNGALSDNQAFRFRLPKLHTTYNYFNDFDRSPAATSALEGERFGKTGRFMFETAVDTPLALKDTGREVYAGDFTLNLSGDAQGNFLFGNPLMSNISVARLLEENPEVKTVMARDGSSLLTASMTADGTLTGNGPLENIAPMQAVYLATEGLDELSLRITDAMLSGDNSAETAPALRVSLASTADCSSMSIVGAGVETMTMTDAEVPSDLAVFALSTDGRALTVIPADADRIPLTLINRATEPLTLSFYALGGFPREDYQLQDMESGTVYPLDMEITFPADMPSTAGRFCLMRNNSQTGITDTPVRGNVYVQTEGNNITVKSSEANVLEVRIYNPAGVLTARASAPEARELTLKSAPGLRLIQVQTTEGVQTFKIR